MTKWILASQSPRRKELLEQMGVHFRICPARGEEILTKTEPSDIVTELAVLKAQEVADRMLTEEEQHRKPSLPGMLAGKQEHEYLVIGADTIVAYQGTILGKPKDEKDAVRMLTMLSGRTHQVYTGVCLIYIDDQHTEEYRFYEKTDVTMYSMSAKEITSYVRTGEPMDKAGSYGIQGRCAIYIKEIKGDYNNVVGLPIARLYQEIKKNLPDVYAEVYDV